MIKFNKLKVKGFKSFVEPTEIIIENGLTGIVGPNGCGKSNLVEAFRFVMGELSPKQMRGSELDDVIFNGTSDRPAWDIAEVTIDLDNSERKAPSIFNQNDKIEVTRRIWRGEGSEYRVNGKEVRLKDVQLLFADASTGARSTSMVSQGRVGAIIAAKPEQRRSLLEEAAGITGLHSRRHEAELRLNSTENNLERVKDVLETQDEQLEILKKQSKQAERYKNIQKDIDTFLDNITSKKDLGIELKSNVFKVRVANSNKNKGKSAGYRLISYLAVVENELHLLYIYDKSKLVNITEKEVDELVTKHIENN